ncbi:hypothetical protein Tco_0461153 [Tanacetum coccineum]
MTTLQFADTHNLVEFLAKPAAERDVVTGTSVWQDSMIFFTEASIRRDLQLDDEEGMDCLPNAAIFEELTRMRVTPLFPTMVVQAQEEMGEGSAMPTDPYHTPIITQPSSSQHQRKQKSKRPKRKDTEIPQTSVPSDPTNVADEAVNEEPKITLVDETQGRHDDDLMFDTGVLNDEEVFAGQDMAEKEVSTADSVTTANVAVSNVTTTTTTATKGILLQDLSESRTTTTTIPSKDKSKGIMVKEPLKMKKKDQISYDEQEAIRLQADFDEEVRLARLQAEEQEELTIDEKSKLFIKLSEARKKHFATKKAKEKRNRPPTRAQQRSIMCTYLKNMAGWKHKDLKNKSFANIQELFDKAMKRVNTFIDMDTKLIDGSEVKAEGSEAREESSSKRAEDELEQEKAKKQKVDKDKETTELQSLMKVIPDEEEVAFDAIPLATKPSSIVDYKIIKERKINNYQIIRADGSSKRPEEGYERVLWGDLKTMFEHHVEDLVWRNLQGNKVLVWKLFDS